MKRISAILLVAFLFLIPSFVSASEVILKSGEKLEGKIIEQTDKYVKIDTGVGLSVTYFSDEIDSVDGHKLQVSQAPSAQAPTIQALAVKVQSPPVPIAPIPVAQAPAVQAPAVQEPAQQVPSSDGKSEVVLKTGEKLEGKITERKDKYIKIDTGLGMPMTYYFDEIDTIDGNKVQMPIPVTKKVIAPEDNAIAMPVRNIPVQTISHPDVVDQSPRAMEVPQQAPVPVAVNDAPASVLPPPDLNKNAQGQIQGRPFNVTQAKFDPRMKTLELRQGNDFFPDLEFELFLFGSKGPSWENSEIHITPQTIGMNPHVYKKWKVDGSNIPKQKTYMSGYTLDLTLGSIHDGKIHGTINLHLPDEQGSYVEGSFDADTNKSPGHITMNFMNKGVNQMYFKPGNMSSPGIKPDMNVFGMMAFLAGMGIFGFSMMIIPMIIFWVFPAICLFVISKKTNRGAAWMAFVPIASCFLMCKVAGVRYTWLWLLLAGFIPFIGFIAIIGLVVYLWYLIALALNKPGWWGILTIVPLVGIVAIAYLAFSDK